MDDTKNRDKPGPDPERLKLPHRKWQDAVREALDKERPEKGWPEEDKEKPKPGGDEE